MPANVVQSTQIQMRLPANPYDTLRQKVFVSGKSLSLPPWPTHLAMPVGQGAPQALPDDPDFMMFHTTAWCERFAGGSR